MDRFLFRNTVRITAFIVLFLSFGDAFGGNDTIPSSPQTAEEWLQRGSIAHENEQYDEAIKYYKKAIELNPNYMEAYLVLGTAYYEGKKDYDEAIKCFNKAVELDPNLAETYVLLAAVYLEQVNGEKVMECVKKAASLGNKEAQEFLREFGFTW